MGIALSKGDRVHGYTVKNFIAGGGEGSVYAATSPSGALVALKQNSIAPGDMVSRERVLRQRCLIGHRHPAVVEIFEVFEHKGELFVVMEHCRGEMLREALGRCRRFSLRQFDAFMSQCLKGLGWLHDQGLVHRDIKPENIVLSALTLTECALKIIDIGIAFHVRRSRLTARGMVGTPLYASPEAFIGADLVPDARSDLYSLGVVGFEVLTGVHPYPEDDEGALMRAISSDTRPSASSLAGDIPAGVDAWLQKMMALHREGRFADAKEALAVLAAAVSAERAALPPVLRPAPPVVAPGHVEADEEEREEGTDRVESSFLVRPKPHPRRKPGPEPGHEDALPLAKPAGPPKKRESYCLYLSILNGPFKGKDIAIPHEGITLGRAEVNPDDRRVSCVHARVRVNGELLEIDGRGSVNGLIKEGKRKRRTVLALGERFAMGDTFLQHRKEITL